MSLVPIARPDAVAFLLHDETLQKSRARLHLTRTLAHCSHTPHAQSVSAAFVSFEDLIAAWCADLEIHVFSVSRDLVTTLSLFSLF